MKKSEFLKTLEGQKYRYFWRKLKNVHIQISGNPRSKGSISSTEKERVRAEVINSLHGKDAFRGSVALSLYFVIEEPNPPAIHTLPKNYLDLFMASPRGTPERRKSGLYFDDRQVKFLEVAYLYTGDKSPGLYANCRPIRNLIEDIRVLRLIKNRDIKSDKFLSDELFSDFDLDIDKELDYRNPIEEFQMHGSRKKILYDMFGSDEYWEVEGERLQQKAQEFFLLREDKWLMSGMLGYPDIVKRKKFEEFESVFERSFMTGGAYTLSGLPISKGETNVVKARVKDKLIDLTAMYPFMLPLRTQLSVTIFYIPPRRKGIDLDNLARKFVVPAIHEVFKPPTFHVTSLQNLNQDNEELYNLIQKRLQELKNFPKISLLGYTIIELPRIDTDPEEGEIKLLLGRGGTFKQPLSSIDSLLSNLLRF